MPERPYADAVEVKMITDAKALLAALKSGQIAFANGLSNLDVENLAKSDDFARLRLEGAEKQLYVGSNVTAEATRRRPGPTGDRVRAGQGPGGGRGAPWIGLHRQPAVAEVLRRPSTRRPTAPTPAIAKAKKLIAEVGTIPKLPLTYQPTPIQEALAAIVQSNLGEVGIPVELDPVDGAQFVKQLIGAQFKGLWIATHSWAQYTPSTLTVSAYPFNAAARTRRTTPPTEYTAAADAAWEVADGTSGTRSRRTRRCPRAAGRSVPGRDRHLLGAVGHQSPSCRGPATPSDPSCCCTDAWLTTA